MLKSYRPHQNERFETVSIQREMIVLIYKDFQDLKLSALGFGAMRLPTVGGVDAQVDEPAAKELVDLRYGPRHQLL